MQRTVASSPSSGKGQAGIALIAQDNVMVALQIEALLQDAGVEACVLASSVEAALTALDAHAVTFAVIDVNLGRETSEAVATALVERKLPFVFTTSYDDIPLTKQFPGISVLAKPLRDTLLYQSLATIGVI